MNAVRRGAVLSLIVMLLGALVPGIAFGQSGRTVYVDDSGAADANRNGRCGRPNYNSIQAAVNDQSARRVVVCRGKYTEQLSITRSLTLEGREGAVIQAPATLGAAGSLVSFIGAQESRMRGFTITGATTTDQNVGTGISVGDNARVRISHNRIRDIRSVSLDSVSGSAISVDGGWAAITENRIERYGNTGIMLSGSTYARIDDNVIRGQPASGTVKSQIGISIREGASAEVEDNTITDNRSTDFVSGSYGIVVDLTANVSLRNNEITRNQLGIVLGDEVGNTEVRDNEIRNNTSHGLLIIDASENKVIENEISHNGGDGIRVQSADPPAIDNLIDSNEISGNEGNGISLDMGAINNRISDNELDNNGGYDLLDGNGTPLLNDYDGNDCDNSNPEEICAD